MDDDFYRVYEQEQERIERINKKMEIMEEWEDERITDSSEPEFEYSGV